MKCADPTLCYTNPNTGKRTYRNFSMARPYFIQNAQTVFDCTKCLHCRKKSAYSLAMRCVLHASMYPRNSFLTLTYDETLPTYHNNFNYPDIQKFKKSLRRHCEYHFNKKIDIFNVHEYGKNGKKHWHLVLFNHDFSEYDTPKELQSVKNGNSLCTHRELEKLWPHGYHTIGDVSEASAMYTAQYMEKDFKNNNVNSTKKSDSKHSGIGKPYFLKHYKQILSLGYVPFDGKRIPVPRYFEKLAHKHWAHFNDTSFFFDLPDRKKRYTPFKQGEENQEISDLYIHYSNLKSEFIQTLEEEWNETVSKYIETKDKTDFQKSAENALYDLKNKQQNERF